MDIKQKNLLTLSRMTMADEEMLNEILNNAEICVSIPSEPNENDWIASKTTINLLCRLYSKINVNCTTEQYEQLESIVHQISKEVALFHVEFGSFDVVLNVGFDNNSNVTGKDIIYFGSDGWSVRLSKNMDQVNRQVMINPLTAAVSSCFAANELFKILFKPYLKNCILADSFEISLLDYSINQGIKHNEELPGGIDIGNVWLAGVGAVGNGFLYGLSLLENITGNLKIVDNRSISKSNLQRYILATESDIGSNKTEIIAIQQFQNKEQIQIHPIVQTIQSCNQLDDPFDTLICAVDSIETRKKIQALLPRLILNGWTRMDEFAVTRHLFNSDYRCLSCLYDKVKQEAPDEISEISYHTGLSKEECLALIENNRELTEEHISKIASFRDESPKKFESWIGRPVQSFYQEAICGGVSIMTETGEQTVPLAHISALTGLLLAVELIKEHMNKPLEHKVQLNMLGRPHNYMIQPELKNKDDHCMCSDQDYLKVYEDKWSLNVIK